jgi:preprotein translocase subunit SecG
MKNTANVRPFVAPFLFLMCMVALSLTIYLPIQEEKSHRSGNDAESRSNEVTSAEAEAATNLAVVEEITFSIKPKLGSK